MKMKALATLATMLTVAACQPAMVDGAPAAERRLAEKIIDSGLLIPTSEEGLSDIALEQVQNAVFSGALTQEQAIQALLGFQRAIKPALPEIRNAAIKGMTDQYNVQELKVLAEFFASDLGNRAREKIGPAMQASQELLGQKAGAALDEAIQRVRSAWPATPGPAPAASPTAPAGPPPMGPPPGSEPN